MNSVHSEYLNVTITGNMITRHGLQIHQVTSLLNKPVPQLTMQWVSGLEIPKYDVTHPLSESDCKEFAALIHRLNSKNKLGQKRNPDDKPDGPPPTGGTPGAAKQELFEHVRAMAA